MSELLKIKQPSQGGISKEAEEFNKLISKIEKQKKKIAEKRLEMDECMSYFSNDGINVLKKNLDMRFEYVKRLYKLLDSTHLTLKNDIENLLIYFTNNVEQISMYSEIYIPDGFPDFEKEYKKNQFFVLDEDEIKMAAELLSEHFEDSGIDLDIDFEDWIRSGGTTEDLQKRVLDKQEADKKQISEEHNIKGQKKQSKKTKQSAREAENQIADKNLNDLYRQLARVFHPDLEFDLDKRSEKEELMKELNSAYKEKNLYKMLQMEIIWLSESQERLEKLPDEKLKIYIHSLKQQNKILLDELKEIPAHPQYRILQIATFPYFCDSISSLNMSLMDAREKTYAMTMSMEKMGNGENKKQLKVFIKDVALAIRMLDF